MDFLFAIPSFIFHLISSLFSWVFGVISGIVGIVLWPVKLLWGLLMGVGKTLISIVLLPTLLFSHPADISATQPIVGTSSTVSNTYNLEQIYNDISRLEKEGRKLKPLSNNYQIEQCDIQMQEYQNQAAELVEKMKDWPDQFNGLNLAAKSLNPCLSCRTSSSNLNLHSCNAVRMGLNEYLNDDY